jgi:CHAT domain-containing protein
MLRRDSNQRCWVSAVVSALLLCASCAPRPQDHRARYDSAVTYYRNAELNRAIETLRKGTTAAQGEWKYRFRLLEAQCLLAKNDIDAAIRILSSPEIRNSPSVEITARRRMLEGNAFSKRAEYAEAHEAFEDAYRSEIVDVRIETQLSRAVAWSAQRDLSRGEQSLRDALAIATKHKDTYHEAAVLLNFGLFAVKRGRFDEAALTFQRVLTLCDLRKDTGILKSAALLNLSVCYSRLGDFDRAFEIGKRAVDFMRTTDLRAYLTQSLGEMGNIFVYAGQFAEAIPWYRQANDMASSANVKSQMLLWRSSLAQALAVTGRLDEASHAVEGALHLGAELNDSTRQAWDWMTKGRIEAARGRTQEAQQAFQKTLSLTDQASLEWDAYAELGRLYSQTGDTRQSDKHYENARKLIEQTSSDLLRTDFQITFLSRLTRFYQSYVSKLIADKREERALELADATHARVLAERLHTKSGRFRTTSAGDVRRIARASGAVILSYWLAPEGSHVWVVTKDRIHRESLAPQEGIAKLIDDHRTIIEDRVADPLTTGHPAAKELYNALVRPIERYVPPGSRVILVPDGPLNNINFETLVVSAPSPHYWIEDVTLAIAPSLHLLEQSRDQLSKNALLLIGDAVSAEARYPKLRYASTEMAHLRNYFPSVTERAGPLATPASYAQAQPQGFPMIHFAAHAEANRESPLDSAIILSSDKGQYKLYSRDVAATPIRADLVTLSACRGAGARAYSGEGLVGFSWAFLEAGARNVVAGLWDVSDRSTTELIDHLYKGLTQGNLDAAEALRQSKLAMLRKGGPEKKPFYWAPFQVYTRVYRLPGNHPRKQTNSH